MKVKIITTGGTIDKVYFDKLSVYDVGENRVKHILDCANVNVEHVIVELMRKDSLEINEEDRKKIYDEIISSPERQFLITHGTDTMIKTASKLADITGKTIVMTGAMNPEMMRDSDASFNIGCALAATQILDPGVYIAMNGQVIPWEMAIKNRDTMSFERR